MSLIYDALRSEDRAARPQAAVRTPAWWARQSPQRRGVALLSAGALLAAPLAFLVTTDTDAAATRATPPAVLPTVTLASERAAPVDAVVVDGMPHAPRVTKAEFVSDPDAGSAPVAPVAVDTSATATQMPAQDTPPAATAIAEVPAPPPVPEAALDVAVPVVAAAAASSLPAAVPRPAPQTTSSAQASVDAGSIRVEHRGETAAVREHDDTAVVQAMQAVETAVAANDLPAARHALARLETVLPAGSLTLLRMRAWVAHGSLDMADAESLYRQIIARVPDDVNAGVNIALLDARRGDVGDARDRLTRLAARHVRSPQVARALAELDTLTQ